MFISNLEIKLIERMANEIYSACNSNFITEDDLNLALSNLKNQNITKLEFCSNIETLYYIFSVILSEVRAKKREVMSSLFEQNPKLAQEKSVLKEKLDADEEYAQLHKQEELLFQFVEHMQNIKNNITYLFKEENPLE